MNEKKIIKVLILDPSDNVAIALTNLPMKSHLEVKLEENKTKTIETKEAIPQGHKLALINVECGDWIIKYGERIGKAKSLITAGSHVHVHNVEDNTELLVLERRPK